MEYLTIILGVLVLVLAFACRRLWLATQDAGLRDYTFAIEQANREAGELLYEQLQVIGQLGELLDHSGVALEGTLFIQEGADLKELGRILRRMQNGNMDWELSWCQDVVVELGDRYGIEPEGGGPYSLRKMVRIAEEIMERVLANNMRAIVAA